MILKNALLLIGLSVAAIFFQDQLMAALQFLTHVHTVIARGLGFIFSGDEAGEIVQSVLALLLIPVVLGILLAVAHFFVKQAHFPHTVLVVWISWAVLLASVLTQSGYVTNHPTACKSSSRQLVVQGNNGQHSSAQAPTQAQSRMPAPGTPMSTTNGA